MGATINLDGVEPWGASALLPLGWHEVRIETAEDEESNGHPVAVLQMAAPAGEHAGFGMRDWLHITPNTLGRIRQVLEAAKYDIPSGDFQFPTSALPGRMVRILVGEEPKQDGSGMKRVVKAYAPSEGGTSAQAATPATGASKADADIPF